MNNLGIIGRGFCVLVAWFLCLASTMCAQEWVACSPSELLNQKKRSDALYTALSTFRWDVQLRSYKNASDPVPYETMTATTWKEGHAMRANMGGVISIQDALLRLVIDEEDRVIMVNDVAEGDGFYLAQLSEKVILGAAACSKRMAEDGTEFKLVFPKGAQYDQLVVLYDPKGWLRRTESFWRIGVQEFPDEPLSATYKPKVVMEYGVPKPLTASDRGKLLKVSDVLKREGSVLNAIGPWNGYEVIDGRFRP